jgi:hypothetical protein
MDYTLETKGSVPMRIAVTPYEKGLTKVVVKISLFGDKDYVELFYKLVDDHLAKRTITGNEKAARK